MVISLLTIACNAEGRGYSGSSGGYGGSGGSSYSGSVVNFGGNGLTTNFRQVSERYRLGEYIIKKDNSFVNIF